MLKSLRVFTRLNFSHPTYISRARFGGGHHHEVEYDWRDDPKVNKDLVVDIRDVGWHPEHYTFPYEAPADTWLFASRPLDYNGQDITLNYLPENKRSDVNYGGMRVRTFSLCNERLLTGTHLLKLPMRLIMNQKIWTSSLRISKHR
jgi:hypothetical protein